MSVEKRLQISSDRRCSVCGAPHYARGFCQMHYQRWNQFGDPGQVGSKLMPRGDACSVPECGEPVLARGLCNMHYARQRKHGDVHTVLTGGCYLSGADSPVWGGDAVTYHAAHGRVYRTRGSAKGYRCIDCGNRAAQWSYDGGAGSLELHAPEGDYCADPGFYDPRCISCHKKFDLHVRRTIGLKFIPSSENDLVGTLELSRRNIEILIAKLSDPKGARTLIDPDGRIAVRAVEDHEHYADREPGPMFMPSTGEFV